MKGSAFKRGIAAAWAICALTGATPASAQQTIRVGWTIPAEESKYWMMKRPAEFPDIGKTYNIEWVQFQGTAPMTQALAAGALDCATQSPLALAQGAVNGNLNSHLGIVADMGGQYKSVAGVSVNNYQFLFGPQISARMEKVTPFAHMLFGVNRTSAAGVSSSNLGLGVGGGLDVNVSPQLSLRVPQFDWTPVHAGGVWNNNVVRVGFGLVLRIGER